MREQLTQYVELLFAGAPNSEDIKQEILQNTLDRYDDLVAQGKSPEAAYRLAISGIGDVNEILGTAPQAAPVANAAPEKTSSAADEVQRRKTRAIAIAFYILCPVPVIILGDIGSGALGVTLMFALIAAATALLIMNGDKDEETPAKAVATTPQRELKKSVRALIWAIGLCIYFALSFVTAAWYITWVFFPIIGCVQGLANAIIDLKEANKHEK